MPREPILMCVCGKKRVGKSYKTIDTLRKYVKGDPAKGIPGRKVLIFDVNNEYSDKSKFPDIRAIKLKDVPLFAARPYAEIRRVAPFFDDGRKMTLNNMAEVVQWILNNYYNGGLLVEDINKYISDSMPSDIIGAICTNSHSGIDIWLHYQSIGRINPKVWQNLNIVRLHKNTDSVDRHKNKFEDKYEILKIAEKIIWNRYRNNDIRFYLFCDFDSEKIRPGDEFPFTQEEIINAITEQVSENYNFYIAPKLNRVARDGAKIYTPEKAFEETEARLLDQYFGE